MLKRTYFYILLLFTDIIFSTCNKPNLAFTTTFTKSCTVNGVSILNIVFITEQLPYNNSVFIYFQNAGLTPIANAKIFIEMCSILPQNYDNCGYQKTINIGNLNINDTVGYQLLGANLPIIIDADHINVGIIDYDTTANNYPFANDYLVNNSTSFGSSNNTFGVLARGYIFIDGYSVFRFKMYNADTLYYNAIGNFIGTSKYSGNLFNMNNALISSLILDSTKKSYINNDSFNCTIDINTPVFDSLKYININLLP